MISPKSAILPGLLLLATAVFAQSEKEKNFNQVVTLQDAYRFADKYASQKAAIHVLNSDYDSTARDRKLYQMKVGETARVGNSTYKIIEDSIKCSFRASYIYLDGSKLTLQAIDSIRSLILKQYAGGTSFEDLCDRYTMDGNAKHGDLGFWEAGMMVNEFEKAVRIHSTGEIFTVDVPENKWYYVVKKTADNKVENVTLTVLEMN